MSVERLAGLLARRLQEEGVPEDAPVSVAELRRQLLPYPYCRERLGLASKAEYDLAMLELLGDPGLLELDDPDLEEAVEREAGAPEPALGFLEDFAAVQVRPGPTLAERIEAAAGVAGATDGGATREGGSAGATDGGRRADIGPAGDEQPVRLVDGDGEGSGDADGGEVADGNAPVQDGSATVPDGSAPGPAGGSCRSCGGDLPARPGLRFCPWCGVDQTARSCRACGTELEPEWKFCPECGEPADG